MRLPVPPADDSRVWKAFTAFLVMPVVVAVLVALFGDWFPVGDDGLLMLRVDDVGSSDHPWLGSWTSLSITAGEDVNNPGAWYTYLAALPVALLGPIAGGALAVGLLNALMVTAIVGSAHVLGGVRAAVGMGAATAGLCWAMGSELLIDLWQPHALLLPATLFMVLAVGVADGRARFVPLLFVVTSIILQTHLGYGYVLAMTVVVVLTIGGLRRRDALQRGLGPLLCGRTARWTALALALTWLPALIDLLLYGGDSNLARLARSLGAGDSTLGPAQAVRVAGQVLVAPWSRLRFGNALTPGNADGAFVVPGLGQLLFAVLVLGALALLLWAFRRTAGSTALRTALTVAIAALPITLIALSLLPLGPLVGVHQIRWVFAIGIFVWGVLGWAVLEHLRTRSVDLTGALAVVAIAAAFATTIPYAQDHGPVRERWARPTLHALDDALGDLDLPEPLFYDTANLRFAEPFSGPLMMLLGDRGIDFRVEQSWVVHQVGRGRSIDGTEVGRLYQVEGAPALWYPSDDCRVLMVDGVSDEKRAEIRTHVDDLTSALLDGSIPLDRATLEGREDYTHLVEALDEANWLAVEQVVLAGTLGRVADDGLMDGDAAARVTEVSEEISSWVRTVYALYLETDGPCPG